MAAPDFLQFHCANNDSAACATCPRDFVVPINAIEGIFKDNAGKALVLIKGIHYCPGPDCVNKLRYIETASDFTAVVSKLDGKVENIGDILMTYQDNLPKGS